jgi:hypothetical protein
MSSSPANSFGERDSLLALWRENEGILACQGTNSMRCFGNGARLAGSPSPWDRDDHVFAFKDQLYSCQLTFIQLLIAYFPPPTLSDRFADVLSRYHRIPYALLLLEDFDGSYEARLCGVTDQAGV